MKKILIPLLTVIISAGILLCAHICLRAPIAEAAAADHQQMMEALLPGSSTFTQEEYIGEDTNIVSTYKGETGYVVEAVTYGYAGDIKLWVGVDNKGAVTGVMVRDMSETFGLGQRAMSDPVFLAQFLGTKGNLTVGENVDALTGATVTSKAITKAMNSASGFVAGADVVASATEWGG